MRVVMKFFVCLCWCMLFFLSGCTSQHQHDLNAQAQRACISDCQLEMKQCQARCVNNCTTCEKEAVRETKKDYQRYLKERCVGGKSFIRRLQSYHDPLQCRKTTCDCPADLRVCVESCRGSIHKQIQVEKSCC